LTGPAYPADISADEELEKGLPFLEILIVSGEDFERLISRTFATDRFGVPKGMIEVIL
jgi:hypothetical protein